jgi:hypothetical protein
VKLALVLEQKQVEHLHCRCGLGRRCRNREERRGDGALLKMTGGYIEGAKGAYKPTPKLEANRRPESIGEC